jgi:hypothetical protein
MRSEMIFIFLLHFCSATPSCNLKRRQPVNIGGFPSIGPPSYTAGANAYLVSVYTAHKAAQCPIIYAN